MEKFDLRDVVFSGASFVETYKDGTTGEWEVVSGGVNPGSLGFHLTRNHGAAGKTAVFYPNFFSEMVRAKGRTITFTRRRKNSPEQGQFPDQPWPEVKKVVVTWK